MIRIDVESFKQCFKEKEGVVINTFHGVKGEEYTTVIAFGLLYGYVPHWNIINNKPLRYQTDETKKLLYVVCSRAKKNLYLFSEQGRTTKKGWELPPTKEIESVAYMYDDLEIGDLSFHLEIRLLNLDCQMESGSALKYASRMGKQL